MAIAKSKLTAQGQISVPAEVRRRLGLAPGSVLEWDELGPQIVVRRAAEYTWTDIHARLFGKHPPQPRTLKELKEGLAEAIREDWERSNR